MKFSTTLSLGLAHLALAKSVRNVYDRREVESVSQGEMNRRALESAGLDELVSGNSLNDVVILWTNAGFGADTVVLVPGSFVSGSSVSSISGSSSVSSLGSSSVSGLGSSSVGSSSSIAGVGTASSGAASALQPLGSSGLSTSGRAPINITVGGPAQGKKFEPDSVVAQVGDQILFKFLSVNHSVTQASFDTPCVPLAGGFSTGFNPNPNNDAVNPPMVMMIVTNAKTPLWFHCGQTGHCGAGMVFSINPTLNKSQALFQSKAISENGKGSGSAILGTGSSTGSTSVTNGTAAAESDSAQSLTATLSALAGAASTGAFSGAVATGLASTSGASDSNAAGSSSSGIATGSGTLQADGSCLCAVTCQAGSFPNPAVQGNNAFGGVAGQITSNMVI